MRWITVIFLFISVSLNATNYYVKNGGSDAANGLTDGTAWATMTKVNATSFLPGDTVFFNKGDTWDKQLVPKTSGTSGNYIVFTSYGTGLKPCINGYVQYTGWQTLRTNIYYVTNVYQSAFRCLFNDSIWGAKVYTTADLNVTREWLEVVSYPYAESNDTLFIYTTNPSDTSIVSFSKVTTGIDIRKDYIKVIGLEMRHIGAHGVMVQLGGDNVIIDGCKTNWCGGQGVYFATDANTCTAQNDSILNSGNDGVYFGPYASNGVLDNCYIAYSGENTSLADRQTLGVWFCKNMVFSNNTVYQRSAGTCFEIASSVGNYYQDNINIFNNHITYSGSEHVFNVFFGDYTIHHNIVIMTGAATTASFIYSGESQNTPSTVNAYNNTVIDAGYGVRLLCMWNPPAGNSVFNIKNNIFKGVITSYISPLVLYTTSETVFNATTDMDNNLYGDDTGTKFKYGSTNYNFADYKTATGQDSNSVVGDPLFVSTSDLSLQAESPAIDIGVELGYVYDYAGNIYTDTPDAGVYEYGAEPPPPPGPPVVTTVVSAVLTYRGKLVTHKGKILIMR